MCRHVRPGLVERFIRTAPTSTIKRQVGEGADLPSVVQSFSNRSGGRMSVLDIDRDFNVLSLPDLLAAREMYHLHLMVKQHVVGPPSSLPHLHRRRVVVDKRLMLEHDSARTPPAAWGRHTSSPVSTARQ